MRGLTRRRGGNQNEGRCGPNRELEWNSSSMRGPLTPLLMLLLGAACGAVQSPTQPAVCRTSVVFAREPYYAERTEAERDFSGTLERRDTPSTPNGRDHRYFLNGTPVYSGGNFSEPAFQAAVGSSVVIRGKLVDVGYGAEIWTASLTSCR